MLPKISRESERILEKYQSKIRETDVEPRNLDDSYDSESHSCEEEEGLRKTEAFPMRHQHPISSQK